MPEDTVERGARARGSGVDGTRAALYAYDAMRRANDGAACVSMQCKMRERDAKEQVAYGVYAFARYAMIKSMLRQCGTRLAAGVQCEGGSRAATPNKARYAFDKPRVTRQRADSRYASATRLMRVERYHHYASMSARVRCLCCAMRVMRAVSAHYR